MGKPANNQRKKKKVLVKDLDTKKDPKGGLIIVVRTDGTT
jgi:hypothetical protein